MNNNLNNTTNHDDSTVIKLNAEDSRVFIDSFSTPSEPNQALKDAAILYQEMINNKLLTIAENIEPYRIRLRKII